MAKHPMSDALDKAEAYLKQRQAERRLADAAPDLLAILKAAAEDDTVQWHDGTLLKAARAAISRAEGREP